MRSLDRIRNEIETIIKEGGLEQTTLNFFFSRIRIVLEKENSKKNYPYLSMVCNWYQHHEITRSTIGYEIIKDVGDLIFEDKIGRAHVGTPVTWPSRMQASA